MLNICSVILNKFVKLLFSLVIVLVLLFIGSLSSENVIDTWYADLNKPSFTPPNIVFPIVWPILYVLIGLSLFAMLVKKTNRPSIYSYSLFVIQLFLNGVWSYLFFTLHNFNLALIDIYLLLLVIVLYMFSIRKTCRAAFFMFIPYLLWVAFASVLFTNLWILN